MTAVKRIQKKIAQPILNFLLGKVMSKKLTIMIISTVALFLDKIDGDNFMFISIVYIGFEAGNNYLEILKLIKSKNKTNFDYEINTSVDTEG